MTYSISLFTQRSHPHYKPKKEFSVDSQDSLYTIICSNLSHCRSYFACQSLFRRLKEREKIEETKSNSDLLSRR